MQSVRRSKRPGDFLTRLTPAERRLPPVRWLLALATFAAGLALRWAVDDVLPPGFPYVTFFPAVMLAAFLCGRTPAILVAILSSLAAWWFFITPGSFTLNPSTGVAISFFAFVCAMLIWLIDRLTRERQAHAAREAQLRAIMDTVPVGIILAELPSGRILEGSSHVERMLKHPVLASADIHAYDEWESYHADGSRVSGYEYPLARMVQENAEAPEIEVHYQRGDGERAWTRIMGRPIRDAWGELIGGVVALIDVDSERRAEQETQRLADEFRTLADNIPTLCWMARPDGHIYWYNQRWYDYTGTSPDSQEGWGWESVHDPAMLPKVAERWRHSIETGEPFEMVFPLKRADGVFRPFLTRILPIHDAAGRVTRWFGANIDVTEQQHQEQQQQLLINELNHRVKNTLATVQSLAAQTLRSGKTPEEVFRNFESRLLGLSEAHNLLTQGSWEGADIGELAARAVRPFQTVDQAVRIEGPKVWLRSESALGLAMALHELAANAALYGALSTPQGRVAVRWDLDDDGAFQFTWRETHGPVVEAPARRGFGLRLIERALAAERGKAELQFAPEGLVCRITARLPAPQSQAA